MNLWVKIERRVIDEGVKYKTSTEFWKDVFRLNNPSSRAPKDIILLKKASNLISVYSENTKEGNESADYLIAKRKKWWVSNNLVSVYAYYELDAVARAADNYTSNKPFPEYIPIKVIEDFITYRSLVYKYLLNNITKDIDMLFNKMFKLSVYSKNLYATRFMLKWYSLLGRNTNLCRADILELLFEEMYDELDALEGIEKPMSPAEEEFYREWMAPFEEDDENEIESDEDDVPTKADSDVVINANGVKINITSNNSDEVIASYENTIAELLERNKALNDIIERYKKGFDAIEANLVLMSKI